MRTFRICAASLLALALLPGDALARSAGGFSSSGGSRGFSAPAARPSAPSYAPKPSTPSYTAPRASPPSFGSPSKGFSAPAQPAQRVAPAPAPAAPRYVAPQSPPKTFTTPAPKAEPQRKVYDAEAARARELEQSQRAFRDAQEEKRKAAAKAAEKAVVPPIQKAEPKAASPKEQPAPAYEKYAREKAAPPSQEKPMLPPSYYERQRERERAAFNPPPPVVERHYYQQDGGISPWFWIWLMSQNNHSRDEWVYHHRESISPSQMEDLRRKDADLDRRLSELEGKGVKRDPSILVTGIDDKAPAAPVAAKAETKKVEAKKGGGWFSKLMWLAFFGGAIYVLFFHKWASLRRRYA